MSIESRLTYSQFFAQRILYVRSVVSNVKQKYCVCNQYFIAVVLISAYIDNIQIIHLRFISNFNNRSKQRALIENYLLNLPSLTFNQALFSKSKHAITALRQISIMRHDHKCSSQCFRQFQHQSKHLICDTAI